MSPVEATDIVGELEHTTNKESLKKLGLFSLQKRRPREDLTAAFTT